MTLHLLKLCVGADSLEDLLDWQKQRLAAKKRKGQERTLFHTTRMVPRRKDELLAGGSLYWVIKGTIQARQTLLDIRPFIDDDGIRRCHLILSPETVPTAPQPRRPFQGWRYLEADDAPRDLSDGAGSELPPELRAELLELGLL